MFATKGNESKVIPLHEGLGFLKRKPRKIYLKSSVDYLPILLWHSILDRNARKNQVSSNTQPTFTLGIVEQIKKMRENTMISQNTKIFVNSLI